MATELQITTWRNVLDLMDEIKADLKTVNDQTKLQMAAYITGDLLKTQTEAERRAALETFVAPSIPSYMHGALVGFAITKIGVVGKKLEWLKLVGDNVLGNTSPSAFVYKAYNKSTGKNVRFFPLLQYKAWVPAWRRAYQVHRREKPKVTVWLRGQAARSAFILNDIVRATSNLQLELTRVRVPMPPKFRAWLDDVRDTAISVSAGGDIAQTQLYLYRLYELTTFKGQLVTDFSVIKAFVDKQIAEIERAASAPAPKPVAPVLKPAPVSKPAPAPKPVAPVLKPAPVSKPAPAPMPAPVVRPAPAPAPAPPPLTAEDFVRVTPVPPPSAPWGPDTLTPSLVAKEEQPPEFIPLRPPALPSTLTEGGKPVAPADKGGWLTWAVPIVSIASILARN